MSRLLLIFIAVLALAKPAVCCGNRPRPIAARQRTIVPDGADADELRRHSRRHGSHEEALAKNAEVVAVYLDWGVPWPEAFEGQPFHENVRKEIAAVKQRISPQHQVFLALNAGAFNRREMAGYWGEKTQMPRPGRWADKELG